MFRLFGRGPGRKPGSPGVRGAVVAEVADAEAAEDRVRTPYEAALDDEGHFCVCCGRALGFDPEDEPDGEGPGCDICGNCNRGRSQDVVDEAAWRDGH